ncbi:RNA polymerase sigma factor [Streptomyces sp. NRRL WC-3742]|uniref:RNA polymerase sigma factor n=1 Tax=Streptomyces sp. NRRL WC-3742 TaxID=1463934 RepID=UPI00068EF215|nr:sigma-70 family RNA polymerase sigma factor [Streptomyces sp. NRRL WC-3742]
MTSDDEWTSAVRAHRLSYEVFCDEHERAWRGLARARLHDHRLIERAVRDIREELRHLWAAALREPAPAGYAWMVAKRHVADLALWTDAGTAPPRAVLPDWERALRNAWPCEELAPPGLGDHERLHAAILRLPERQYDVIVLRYVLGLAYPAIAVHLGITEAGARSAAVQGLDKLHRLLGSDTAALEERR